MAPRKRSEAQEAQDDESPEARRRRREEFERTRVEDARALADARRKMFTQLRLWTVCPDKRCVRAKACAGNVERCLHERWHALVPPQTKSFLHKALTLVADGYGVEEAVRIAREQMQRHAAAAEPGNAGDAHARRAPAPQAAEPPPVPAASHPRHPLRGPRVRRL